MGIENFTTLVEVEQFFRKKGYLANFKFEDGVLKNPETAKKYGQNEIKVIARRRFEGATNPGDMSILFALEADDGTKGQLISAFGTYADADLLQFMDEVKNAAPSETGGPLYG